ncbi:MAG: O-antigen ligase family protein [Elusimicrobia bacterium]|nr:O-antigen ligase family protein [Elusimicrobiota bacterium]
MRSLTPVAAALALTALALPLSIAASNIALALLALALILRARTDGRAMLSAWRSEPVLAALAAYAAAGLLAAACSSAPGPSLRDAVKDLHRLWAMGLFVAALAVEPGAPLLPALGLSFGAAALTGAGQVLLGGLKGGMMVRAHAFVHPVVFGEQMAVAALGGACVLLRPGERDARGRAAVAAFALLAATALILSQTRMALFAAAAGFAVVALLEPRARRWALPAMALVVVSALTWEVMPNGGRTLSALFRYDPANPQQVRWTLWDTAWRMFRDRPWTGVGPGGFHRLFPSYHASALDGETHWGSAHNLYLHQLAERGLAGAAALAALLGLMASRAVRAARTTPDARALWAAGAVCAFLVLSLTETSFQNEQFSALLLLVWAWGTAALRRGSENL